MSSSPSRLLKHYSQSRAGHEKILMTWSDIEYSILVKDPKASKPFHSVMKSKTIISSMSGSAESGELLAIMGPTGLVRNCIILKCTVTFQFFKRLRKDFSPEYTRWKSFRCGKKEFKTGRRYFHQWKSSRRRWISAYICIRFTGHM